MPLNHDLMRLVFRSIWAIQGRAAAAGGWTFEVFSLAVGSVRKDVRSSGAYPPDVRRRVEIDRAIALSVVFVRVADLRVAEQLLHDKLKYLGFAGLAVVLYEPVPVSVSAAYAMGESDYAVFFWRRAVRAVSMDCNGGLTDACR